MFLGLQRTQNNTLFSFLIKKFSELLTDKKCDDFIRGVLRKVLIICEITFQGVNNFINFKLMYKFKISYLLLFVSLILNGCSEDAATEPVPINKGLHFFAFKMIQNASLHQDINCEIIGDTIYASTFSGTNLSNLIPTFLAEGLILSVAGKMQISGQTPQNFNSLITYTTKVNDGSNKQYVVKFTDTNIPVLYISTNNKEIQSKTTYVKGNLKIKQYLTGDSLYGGEIEIRGRGNSTWNFPKKPYKIKLNKKAGLLGMNESKQWILLANYADKSLIRNEVGFELSRRFGYV